MGRYDDDHFWMDYEDEKMRREAEWADDPEPKGMAKFLNWIKKSGWKGELVKGLLLLATFALIWFGGLLVPSLIVLVIVIVVSAFRR